MVKSILFIFLCVGRLLSGYSQFSDYEKPAMLKDGLRTSTLKKEGINKDFIKAMEDSIISGAYTNIHSVLIVRNNQLVYERYFAGTDQVRGIGPTGVIPHHRDSLHDIRSVSKSIVSAAIMIALGQEKIKSLDQRVLDYFPEYSRYDTGLKRSITIRHLLNMSAGLDWKEGSGDSSDCERKMNRSVDALDFVLSRKMVAVPGTTFNYNGGCTELLSAIIKKVSDKEINRFVDQYLFQPIGIKHYTWVSISDGRPSGASGLRMRSRDMAKFGQVYLNNGKWKNKQVIPADLVAETLKKQISTYDSSETYRMEYSNQFWINVEKPENEELSWVQCQGNGGQIILIHRKFHLVIAITAGNYNLNVRRGSWDIFLDFIYPALTK